MKTNKPTAAFLLQQNRSSLLMEYRLVDITFLLCSVYKICQVFDHQTFHLSRNIPLKNRPVLGGMMLKGCNLLESKN